MKTTLVAMGGILLLSYMAAAEDTTPKMETFLGYTFTRFNSATNVPAFSANGGSGQFAYNFNKWLSGVVDLGAVHNGNINSVHLDSTLADFLAGPRLSMRKWSRITPYVQTLFGSAYATSSIAVPPELVTIAGTEIPVGDNLRATQQENGFALTAGGGLDIKVSKHVSFRPIQLEYFRTELAKFRTGKDNIQHNLRYSAGVNFTFGEAQ